MAAPFRAGVIASMYLVAVSATALQVNKSQDKCCICLAQEEEIGTVSVTDTDWKYSCGQNCLYFKRTMCFGGCKTCDDADLVQTIRTGLRHMWKDDLCSKIGECDVFKARLDKFIPFDMKEDQNITTEVQITDVKKILNKAVTTKLNETKGHYLTHKYEPAALAEALLGDAGAKGNWEEASKASKVSWKAYLDENWKMVEGKKSTGGCRPNDVEEKEFWERVTTNAGSTKHGGHGCAPPGELTKATEFQPWQADFGNEKVGPWLGRMKELGLVQAMTGDDSKRNEKAQKAMEDLRDMLETKKWHGLPDLGRELSKRLRYEGSVDEEGKNVFADAKEGLKKIQAIDTLKRMVSKQNVKEGDWWATTDPDELRATIKAAEGPVKELPDGDDRKQLMLAAVEGLKKFEAISNLEQMVRDEDWWYPSPLDQKKTEAIGAAIEGAKAAVNDLPEDDERKQLETTAEKGLQAPKAMSDLNKMMGAGKFWFTKTKTDEILNTINFAKTHVPVPHFKSWKQIKRAEEGLKEALAWEQTAREAYAKEKENGTHHGKADGAFLKDALNRNQKRVHRHKDLETQMEETDEERVKREESKEKFKTEMKGRNAQVDENEKKKEEAQQMEKVQARKMENAEKVKGAHHNKQERKKEMEHKENKKHEQAFQLKNEEDIKEHAQAHKLKMERKKEKMKHEQKHKQNHACAIIRSLVKKIVAMARH